VYNKRKCAIGLKSVVCFGLTEKKSWGAVAADSWCSELKRGADGAKKFLVCQTTGHALAPPLLQTSLAATLISRWTAWLSHAAMHAFAASLLAQDCSNHTNVEGNQPSLSQVLAEAPLHFDMKQDHFFNRRIGGVSALMGQSGTENITLELAFHMNL